MRETPARVVVLASGTGSLLQSLIDATEAQDYPARIIAVGVDRDCDAVRRADEARIPHFRVGLKDYADRAHWDIALTDAVLQLVTAVSGVVAILGRVSATTRIGA